MTDTFERLKAALADRYAIERKFSAGGMATVYLAEDLKHKRNHLAWLAGRPRLWSRPLCIQTARPPSVT